MKRSLAYTVTENGTVSLEIPGGGSFGLTVEDRDGDRIPDDWEIRYGLNPDNPADAEDDPDNDGENNRAEFTADSDPTVSGISQPEEPGNTGEDNEGNTDDSGNTGSNGGGGGGGCFISAAGAGNIPAGIISAFGFFLCMAVIRRNRR